MDFHGYEIIRDWKTSQQGQTAIASKGGKRYFLKRYNNPVMPLDNGSLTPEMFDRNVELFEKFKRTRSGINREIRKISGPGGNIVIPSSEFVDVNKYVEASELVDGAVPDEDVESVLESLPIEAKKLLMQTAAGALSSVHAKGIVHSDLKLKNILLVRVKRDGEVKHVAKLIDFDSSFFVDDKPDEIIGTIEYYSPELGEYADSEDDREALADKVTEKTDIFSLGMIFHQYLSGSFPMPQSLPDWLERRKDAGRPVYCWVAMNCGCPLELSPRIDNPKYASLIRDMLNKDPALRPSAAEVLARLREPDPVIEDSWPEHMIDLDKEKMRSGGISGLRKVSSSGIKRYELLFRDGRKEEVSKEDLIAKGYVARKAPETFCEPWSEHAIIFDEDKMKSRGFVSSEQRIQGGIKGYGLYRADASSNFLRLETLLALGYARKIGASLSAVSASGESSSVASAADIGFDSPWPEHGIEFDQDAIRARGFAAVKQDVKSGVKGYSFFRPDGLSQFIRAETALALKMAKKI